MYYCYRHIREDKNEPFYIGIGKVNLKKEGFKSQYYRMFIKHGRNDIWSKIANKTTWYAEVIYETESLDEIKNKEREMISLYRRIKNGGILANLTDGGDGVYNLDKEIRDRITNFNKGSKRSEQSKLKMSIAASKRSKKVYCITNGKTYISGYAAEKELFGCKTKGVYNSIRRNGGEYKGMKFKFI